MGAALLVSALLSCTPATTRLAGTDTADSGAANSDSGETGDTGDTIDTSDTSDTSDSGDTAHTADTSDTADTGTPPRAPPLASFHIIDRDDVYSFDAIRALSDELGDPGPMINSQNRPDDLPAARWAQKINATWYATGQDLADAVHAALSAGDDAPATVLVDELNSNTVTLVADGAAALAAQHPEWRGRWGAWIVNGESVAYSGLNPGIDALLDAGADLVLELYAAQSHYCRSGGSAGSRDAWLADFFRGGSGDFPQDRLVWLMGRRADRASTSRVSIAFGVTDTYLDGTNPAIFLDRMFYVWMTRSKYRSLALLPNGGVGAYKWDDPAMSNTSRDLAFAESFRHYVIDAQTSSRSGQVDCD